MHLGQGEDTCGQTRSLSPQSTINWSRCGHLTPAGPMNCFPENLRLRDFSLRVWQLSMAANFHLETKEAHLQPQEEKGREKEDK